MKVVYIGEAPGKQEMRMGKPFVGPAGAELWKWSPLLRQKVDLITNLLSWQPPKNRDPKPSEVEKEWPRLMQELNRVQPELIVTLGRLSTAYLLGVESVDLTRLHGLPYSIDCSRNHHLLHPWLKLDFLESQRQVIIFPCFHPAAILHQPNLYHYFVEDMKNLKLFMNNELTWKVNNAKPRYSSCGSIRIHDWNICGLQNHTQIAIDTEGTLDNPICLTYSTRAGEARLVYADSAT